MATPLVSVIVPAYNCAGTVFLTIDAVLKQSYPNLELIVVDDGSTDMTREAVAKFSGVQYFFQQNAGPASARNKGAREARGDIIFFTDSDCVPAPDWIATSMEGFNRKGVSVVAGSYGIMNPDNILAAVIHREILFRHGLMPDYPVVFGSYNVGFVKQDFNQVGGFNARYRHASGEDNDLSYRLTEQGYKIFFNKNSVVRHYHPTRWTRYLREQFRHGFWRVPMYFDHPAMTSGDGYTFWKDSVEVIGVYLICFCSVTGIVYSPVFNYVAFSLFCLLLGLEIFFGFKTTRRGRERLVFIGLMTARAFARALGFLTGSACYLLKKNKLLIE